MNRIEQLIKSAEGKSEKEREEIAKQISLEKAGGGIERGSSSEAAHDASNTALGYSMEASDSPLIPQHAAKFAQTAIKASRKGNHSGAIAAHSKAAEAHSEIANTLREDGDGDEEYEDAAALHDSASKFHLQAAEAHRKS